MASSFIAAVHGDLTAPAAPSPASTTTQVSPPTGIETTPAPASPGSPPPALPQSPQAAPLPEAAPASPSEFDFDPDVLPGSTPEPEPAPVETAPAQPEPEDPDLATARAELKEVIKKFKDPQKAFDMVMYTTPEGKRAHGIIKGIREIAEQIGYEPSVSDIRDGLDALGAERRQNFEFVSPDPNHTVSFINHWTSPEFNYETDQSGQQVIDPSTGRPQLGPSLRVLNALPWVLAKSNPDGYKAIATPIANAISPRLRAQGAEDLVSTVSAGLNALADSGKYNEQGTADLRAAVEILKWYIEHNPIPKLISGARSAPAPNGAPSGAPGPSAGGAIPQEIPANHPLQREVQKWRNQAQQATQALRSQTSAKMIEAVKTNVATNMARFLDKTKGSMSAPDFEAVVAHETNELLNKIYNNPEFKSQFSVHAASILASGVSPETLKPLLITVQRFSKPLLHSAQSRRLQNAADKISTLPGDVSRLTSAATRSEANGGVTAPTSPAGGEALKKLPNETSADYFRRVLHQDLSATFRAQ